MNYPAQAADTEIAVIKTDMDIVSIKNIAGLQKTYDWYIDQPVQIYQIDSVMPGNGANNSRVEVYNSNEATINTQLIYHYKVLAGTNRIESTKWNYLFLPTGCNIKSVVGVDAAQIIFYIKWIEPQRTQEGESIVSQKCCGLLEWIRGECIKDGSFG